MKILDILISDVVDNYEYGAGIVMLEDMRDRIDEVISDNKQSKIDHNMRGSDYIKFKIECPICGEDVESTHYAGEWGTEEEYYHCRNCGYAYEFNYGHYMEAIDGEEYNYSYNSSGEIRKEVSEAFENMRKKYIAT